MKLYYSKGACSLSVRIAINEMGIKCDFESVDLKTKKTESGQDYWTINPKGSVGALEIKPHEVLTENVAIMQYLADTNHATNLLPPVNDFKRYRVLEWLNYITTEVHKSFSPMFNKELPTNIRDSIFIPALLKKFKYLDDHLQSSKYLVGNEFTLPDGYLFVMLTWAKKFNIFNTEWKNLQRYFDQLKQRESIKESLVQEELEMV